MKSNKKNEVRSSKKLPEKSKLSMQTKEKALIIEDEGIEKELSEPSFCIVGIGASAGGLEAVTTLLQHIPADSGMAIVLVQHLSPTHKSMLTEILSKKSAIPVTEAIDGMKVVPNHFYIIPPNASMTIENDSLHLHQRQSDAHQQNLPIDLFLTSLAEYRKDKAIAVILSGTASDGSLGVKAIKGYGGITFAQDETAKFDMMPKNAIATGSIDFILSPEGIAKELVNLSSHPYINPKANIDEVIPEADILRQILMLMRKSARIDFTNYKITTLKRRILRRMMLNNIDTLKKYLSHLIGHPKEIEILSQEVFITVTYFFRDPEIFEALRRDIFSHLAKTLPRKEPIRIWTTGCSTGEEAYSLAINLLEFLEAEDKANTPVQIFATDIMNSSIEYARLGIYPENITSAVSPERLKKFFRRTEKGYQINKSVRDICIFAKQDLTADPPFSKLDLICCRNLLIYLDHAAQKRIIPIFHYALNPEGFLLLGQSESIASFSNLFSAVNKKAKIYSKINVQKPPQLILPGRTPSREISEIWNPILLTAAPSLADIQKEADRLALKMADHTGIVINEAMEVIQFRGDTSRYLKHASGTASLNLFKMVPDKLFVEIRNAVNKVAEKDASVSTGSIRVRYDERTLDTSIRVISFRAPLKGQRYFLIVFEGPASPVLQKPEIKIELKPGKGKTPSSSKDLEQELESTRLHLQGLIEDKEAANEELQAANEEILSTNEELQSLNEEFQSANEELESAKEELQATNEEITTLNDELQSRNVQLTELNDFHINLMNSVELPLVMVGRDLRIRRFTPTAEKVLRLIQSDMGRPLSDLQSDIDLQGLDAMMLQAMNSRLPKELELQSQKGQWYKIQIRPYKTSDDKIDGAVVTFFDVTKLKAYSAYREAIFQTMRQPFLVLDAALRVKSANKAFYETFQVKPENTLKKLIFNLGNGQWNIPALRGSLEDILPKKTIVSDFEAQLDFPQIGQKMMLLNARQIEEEAEGGEEDSILLAIEDITDRKQVERATALLAAVVDFSDDAIISRDLNGVIISWNKSAERFFGYTAEEAIGQSLNLIPPDKLQEENELNERLKRGEHIDTYETTRVHKDGYLVEVSLTLSPIKDADGRVLGTSKIFRDITERREAELEKTILETMEEEQRRIGQDLHDGLCQELAGVALLAKALSNSLSTNASDQSARASDIVKLINDSIDHTRDLARGLSPVEIEVDGLIPALQTFASTIERIYKISCVFTSDESAEVLHQYSSSLAINLYRITQEAVSNSIRHGKAQRLVITLAFFQDHGLLTIQDDGIGFQDQDEKKRGLGLRSMRYRSRTIGAQFNISQGAGGGALVSCSF